MNTDKIATLVGSAVNILRDYREGKVSRAQLDAAELELEVTLDLLGVVKYPKPDGRIASDQEVLPITNYILAQFQRSMTATINASDFHWPAGSWPNHFYIIGREAAFNLFSDVRRDGTLVAKTYRDSLGYEVIVDSN